MARWNATGELDFDFGTNGLQVTSIGSNDELAHSLTIQSDGKIVVAARTWTGTGFDFAVLRYHGNSSATPASLDTSFGTDGIVSFSLGAGTDIARHVFIDPRDTSQNRIVVSGYSHDGTNYIFAIARLHSDGTLDTSFKTVGFTRTALSTGANGITSAIADPENGLGGVMAVGSALSGTDWNISTARYATNGDLNTAFFTVG